RKVSDRFRPKRRPHSYFGLPVLDKRHRPPALATFQEVYSGLYAVSSVNRLRIAQDLTAPHQGSTLAEAVRDVRGRVMLSKTISIGGGMLGVGKGDGAEEERRLWGRISCDVETTIAAAASDVGPALPARLRNFSRGGINLSSGSKFEPGALLSVSLPVGDG